MSISSNCSCSREEDECIQAVENHPPKGLTVECVCPKCGAAHRLKMLWSGRGTPKKYCPPCKGFVSTVESIDFCGIPADIHRGIEKGI